MQNQPGMREALLDMGPQHSRPMTPLTPIGLVLHSTADPGATAQQIRNFFNTHRGASAHLCVDWTESLVMIPWRPHEAEIAWHVGPTANSRFIGIELCESNDPVQFAQGYDNWIALAKLVLADYGWPVDDEHVWSHARVSETFRETTHVDPLPYLAESGKSWQDVMQDLAREN